MLENHPRIEKCLNGLGLLSLGLCLLLSSLGVDIARAETSSSPAAKPAVEVPAEVEAQVFVAAEKDGELEQAPRAADPRREARGDVITLNTRGYNYGPDRPTARPAHPPSPAAPARPDQSD